jgi:hypothetical protein
LTNILTYQPAERSKLSLKIWHLLISKERSKNNVRRIIRGQIFIEHKTSHTDENHPHIIYFPFFGKENKWTRTLFSLLLQKKIKNFAISSYSVRVIYHPKELYPMGHTTQLVNPPTITGYHVFHGSYFWYKWTIKYEAIYLVYILTTYNLVDNTIISSKVWLISNPWPKNTVRIKQQCSKCGHWLVLDSSHYWNFKIWQTNIFVFTVSVLKSNNKLLFQC